MSSKPQKDLVVEAREFLPEVTQERKSAFCKAVTHKVVLSKAEWLIQQLCSEVERLRPMAEQTKPELLSDAALAEIAEMFPHAEYQPEVEEMLLCKFCNGAIDDHKANCVVPHVHALCQTVRALRAQLQTKATLVISDIAKENAALREQYESAVTDFAVEINALREQLAQVKLARDQLSSGLSVRDAQLSDLRSQLAQVENERQELEQL